VQLKSDVHTWIHQWIYPWIYLWISISTVTLGMPVDWLIRDQVMLIGLVKMTGCEY